jgi:hypothetical protein
VASKPAQLSTTVATLASGLHSSGLTNDVPASHSVSAEPLKKPQRQFGWGLRKHRKLIGRSDRPQATEAEARESAMTVAEQEVKPRARPLSPAGIWAPITRSVGLVAEQECGRTCSGGDHRGAGHSLGVRRSRMR